MERRTPGTTTHRASARTRLADLASRVRDVAPYLPSAVLAALFLVAGLIAGGVLPGAWIGLWALLFLSLAVLSATYGLRLLLARRRVGTINVLEPIDGTGRDAAAAAALRSLVEKHLSLSGLPPPTSGAAPPLPPVGPALRATEDARAAAASDLLDAIGRLWAPAGGHDLGLTLLAPGPDGRTRLGVRLVDRLSGELDISDVVCGADEEDAARRAAFLAYVHASRQGGRQAASTAWSNPENLAEWMRLREGRDVSALAALARREPGNASVRIRLGQLFSKSGRWPDAVECYLEVLAAADRTIQADMRYRLAIALPSGGDPDRRCAPWFALDEPTRRRVWRGLQRAAGETPREPPGDAPALATALVTMVRELARSVEDAPRRHTPGRSRDDLDAMRQSARLIRAVAEMRLADEAEKRAVVDAALAALPREPAWQAHYNAACLICFLVEDLEAPDRTPPSDGGRLLQTALEHLVRVVSDPAWRQVSPAIAEERRRWLFDGDPDLDRLRRDAGDAGGGFRHLRARHVPGAVEVHVVRAAAATG